MRPVQRNLGGRAGRSVVTRTLSSAAPAFNVPPDALTSLTKLIVLLVPVAVNCTERVTQPMLVAVAPVVSNVKFVVTPLTVTASGLMTGGAPKLPARSNSDDVGLAGHGVERLRDAPDSPGGAIRPDPGCYCPATPASRRRGPRPASRYCRRSPSSR